MSGVTRCRVVADITGNFVLHLSMPNCHTSISETARSFPVICCLLHGKLLYSFVITFIMVLVVYLSAPAVGSPHFIQFPFGFVWGWFDAVQKVFQIYESFAMCFAIVSLVPEAVALLKDVIAVVLGYKYSKHSQCLTHSIEVFLIQKIDRHSPI